MTKIYTLTLAPSLDSATQTPQIYPEGKLRCSAPVFEPGGGGINVARAVTFLGGKATAIFPVGGATDQHGLTPVGAVAAILSLECWRQSARIYFDYRGEE